MRIRNTITASTLLLALFFSQAGYYFIYNVQQHYYKEIAEEKLLAGISDQLLTVIDVTDAGSDLQWNEEGKEFYLHGQLFDVAKKKNINGKDVIYCFNDKEEGKILQQLNKAVRPDNDQNAEGKNSKQTIKFQFSDFIITAKKAWLTGEGPASDYFSFNDNTVSVPIEIKTPPPRG